MTSYAANLSWSSGRFEVCQGKAGLREARNNPSLLAIREWPASVIVETTAKSRRAHNGTLTKKLSVFIE